MEKEHYVMNKKLIRLLFVPLLIISLYGQTGFSEENTDKSSSGFDYLKGMSEMIKGSYNGETSDKALMEGALKGMFGTMDPYTEYYTNEEAESFFGTMDGSYEGIGISMIKENNAIMVDDVYPGFPAYKAGISRGDRIAEVEGKDTASMTANEVAGLIKGPAGTKVVLGLIKAGETQLTKVEVAREKISISPVQYNIKGDIGYIKINIFNMNVNEYLTKALNELDSKNIKKLILDLRDNPGGDVSQAVEAARKFVPEGLVTKLDFRSEDNTDMEYYSYLKEKKYKMAVLVNKNSASASEILAGAIQDTSAGTLIGTKTYGKAKVQNIYPLLTPAAYEKYSKKLGVNVVNAYVLERKYGISPQEDEIIGWAKITTGMYTTPKGRMIDLKGIDPDISVENTALIKGVEVGTVGKLAKITKPTLSSESVQVLCAEKILKMCGYDVDTPDDKLDSKTFKAIKKFQKDNKLFPYGTLDFSTQQRLNDKLDKLVEGADMQYLKAVELLK